MIVGIVGLGLIGGSLAKAYKANSDAKVLAYDIDKTVLDFAILSGAADGVLDDESMKSCDMILLATYPTAAIEYLRANADKFSKTTLVVDCLGTKEMICEIGFSLAKEHGFIFLGGHPMAGTQNSGFKYARANLYNGASMVIVPPTFDDIELLDRAKQLLTPCGFGHFTVTTAAKHDEMIAFTSQMPHIVSNAFIKSPTAGAHKGFSAGSYKDLTRVAWLNPTMWAELFMENKGNVLKELDFFIAELQKYRDAVSEDDFATLEQLLDEGRNKKKEIDGR